MTCNDHERHVITCNNILSGGLVDDALSTNLTWGCHSAAGPWQWARQWLCHLASPRGPFSHINSLAVTEPCH